MSEVPQIVDLVGVFEKSFAKDVQLISYTSKYLTKVGDNYGSVMLALNLHIRHIGGEIEELPIVAKLPPITNDLYWQLFHPERTCRTENSIYKYLAPAVHRLQLDEGVSEEKLFDGFPKYFGSRISLDSNAQHVDRDAVLLLENLQNSGYRAGNRLHMYDAVHAKLVLHKLAQFHALPIALRLRRSEEFDQFIRPNTLNFDFNKQMDEQTRKHFNEEFEKDIQYITNNNEHIVERVMKLKKICDDFLATPTGADTPYTSLAHFDLWINNLMILYAEDGTPKKVKFVDFQLTQLGSIAHDIIFFLLSSVDENILQQKFEQFLRVYHDAFVECLRSVGIPIGEEYKYEAFLKEIQRIAPMEVPHALFMTKVILADNNSLPDDFKDMDIDALTKGIEDSPAAKRMSAIIRVATLQNFIE